MPTHCVAFECRENYAVFQKRKKSGIDGKMRCQMTDKNVLMFSKSQPTFSLQQFGGILD